MRLRGIDLHHTICGPTGIVRQRGALSSFHIPDRNIADSVWKDRYERSFDGALNEERQGVADSQKELWTHFIAQGGPTPFHRKAQLNERLSLTKHAQTAGFSLIINPHIPFDHFTIRARVVRLQCLVDFLKSAEKIAADTVVAVNPDMHDGVNTTLVGDWFAAESVTMEGQRQTCFTTHAPSIQGRIDEFESEYLGSGFNGNLLACFCVTSFFHFDISFGEPCRWRA